MSREKASWTGRRYVKKWDIQTIKSEAYFLEDALLEAIKKFNFEGCPKHEVLRETFIPSKRKVSCYYVYAYYGRLIVVKAGSKYKVRRCALKYNEHCINDAFIKEIIIDEDYQEDGSEDENTLKSLHM